LKCEESDIQGIEFMKIGLTNEGKIFFISEYETGAGEFFAIYDAYGKDLYYSKNPNLVK
jgi:hypothetical protein